MYKRLPFEQYFIDTSNDYNETGKARFPVQYKTVKYGKVLKHKANYCVKYDDSRDIIQIYFEDTDGTVDWIDNLTFPSKYYKSFKYNGKSIVLRTHRAWGRMYKAMKHQVREDFSCIFEDHPKSEVEIIGWSLGSGQAQLCAQDLFYNYGIKSHVITFGSVKPFFTFSKKVKEYLKDCYIDSYNFACNNDIVTYMPPFSGFMMFNRIKVSLDKFNFFRLFKPMKYHTCYDNQKLYE